MPSIADNLIANEQIVFQSRKHWIAPARDSIPAVLMLLGAALITWLMPSNASGIVDFFAGLMSIARWILLIAAIVWIAYNIVVWRTAEFAVTSLRVLRYEGFAQRRSSETLLSSVSDVKLNVGFIGKSLGYGDLKIFTQSGDAGADDFTTITEPAAFRNAMMTIKVQELAANRSAPAPAPVAPAPVPAPVPVAPAPAPVAPAPSTAEEEAARLVKLAELHELGVISTEEFEAKKAEILARL